MSKELLTNGEILQHATLSRGINKFYNDVRDELFILNGENYKKQWGDSFDKWKEIYSGGIFENPDKINNETPKKEE